ncbi:MAG: sigma-54 dependent transcriptional regulator [Planctomycetaceae bacterium]|jgi:DNA-binding NtrC family response regulator|nr:sigma-54 dependent transcriptional regulator [Planctomycetaceae bacterium]
MLENQNEQSVSFPSPVMIGSSAAMTQLRRQIERVAGVSESVLIQGENGTGKEIVARMLHETSPRNHKPWMALNCPAMSAELMESELFGHKKGAFTGAEHDRVGRFEAADGGTLLLDEISEIPAFWQSKLLRVLQERSFERVGACETIHVDVRILATTNRDLRQEIAAGRFREDLYHRLAVLPVFVPPLRERREDVPELATYFAEKSAKRLNRQPIQFDNTAIQFLRDYHWPGNVRQLENLVTRVSVFAERSAVSIDEIIRWLPELSEKNSHPKIPDMPQQNCLISARFSPECGIVDWNETPVEIFPAADSSAQPFLGMTLDEMEKAFIRLTLEQFGGRQAKTAAALGIGLRTLTTKLKEMGISKKQKQGSPEVF